MKIFTTLILALCLSDFVFAQSSTVAPNTDQKTFKQTVVEKGHNVKRAVKKGAHKIQEMVCRKDDKKCNDLKEKHRAQEQAEFHRDKLSESQDSIQTELDVVP